MSEGTNSKEILAKFFDDGVYSELYACAGSAVTAAYGSASGQPVYAVFQNGAAYTARDAQRTVKTLELAAHTGNPVVTFYDSVGAKLEEGLETLRSAALVTETVYKISGVVPQVAVVLGVCGATNALAAAGADICIAAKEAELFLTAPFTSAAKGDKVANAGSAEYAAKAGIAHIVTETAEEAAQKAAQLMGLLPANNLSAAGVYEFAAPAAVIDTVKYCPVQAAEAVIDADSATEVLAGFGKNVYTALATVNGDAVGVVSTVGELCKNCAAKIARFVRLCDAFSIPVVTLVHTDGFKPSSTEDVTGGMRLAARVAGTYADATTAKVAVITGKAVGSAYVALANADITVAMQGCVVAPVEPTVAVSVLNKDELDAGANLVEDTKKAATVYESTVCSADAAVAAGLADFAPAVADVRASVATALDMLRTKRAQRMPKKHGNMAL